MRSWRRAAFVALALALAGYAALAWMIWLNGARVLADPPERQADAALVLGNRAWLHGAPNPCLTGRVDEALELARDGWVRTLVMSGGPDHEDGRVEADVMQAHARAQGWDGPILLEGRSQSTRENLLRSLPVLQAAELRRVVIVSDPYHLWRVRRLVRQTGFDQGLDVQYAAAPTSCWRRFGMLYRGALREPLAVVHNALHGYLR